LRAVCPGRKKRERKNNFFGGRGKFCVLDYGCP
jgi:hypothetical protein